MHIWTTTKSSYYYNLRCLLRINGHNLCLSYYKSEGAPRRAQSTRRYKGTRTLDAVEVKRGTVLIRFNAGELVRREGPIRRREITTKP